MAGKFINKGGGQEGNTNAETWTEKEALSFGNQVLEYLQKDEKCRSIETACVKCGKYETVFDYLAGKFPVVFEPVKKRAKAIAKSRLMEQGLENEVNPTMAIFLLKNNHDMKDKVESENHNYDKSPERLSKDQIDKLLDKL